ncbi:MAG TPA: polynucleotide adenylyltransferase PcnB [Methylophilaceae bacterium]|nr:polynucleotide adenylyltransferase PcnB [Methylophilaceae bacterium]
MIKRFLQKVFTKRTKAHLAIEQADASDTSAAKKIPAKVHKINKSLISQAALKTCEGLQKAGFEAFIVGGAVRDLLLNFKPKDFDVATNATPEEVNRIFRRSRIIGKRFRLVHVLWGNETIEVSTFRGHHLAEGDAKTADSGRILRDNIFGSLEEDAARRDFTANALYYNPAKDKVLDFHNGVADVNAKLLRMIGNPTTRYQEDPVRMLRAVRLSAKLGMKIAPETQAPIAKLVDLLQDVPASRLFDEMLKLFLSGHAVESVNALRAQNLHHGLLPMLDVVLEQPLGERFVMLALKNTDERILAGKSSNPSFLFATLLWHEVLAAWQTYKNEAPQIPALYMAMNEVIASQAEKLAIHNRYTATMKEIWAMQPRFEQRAGKRPFSLLTHPRYRAGYDFLLLRCESGELPMELGEWWTAFANAEGEARTAMLQADSNPKKRRKRNRKKVDASKSEPNT